ncbi:magnesium-dependent phosphatase-1 [Baffinella frigidus]|nr:magnesium-dependent phosphatase-1 [Cryptophyta sp. CCMP2293]
MPANTACVPLLVVFDLDACLWDPEMFQLSGAPQKHDASDNSVVCQGGDRVRLYPGSLEALRALRNEERFKGTKVAAASSTTEPEFARKCLSLLQVEPGVRVNEVITFTEIYNSNKSKHFAKLKASTGVDYSEMIFFDDCSYGDNCGDVERGCPGVIAIRTPDGMTGDKWREGLAKFARSKGGGSL